MWGFPKSLSVVEFQSNLVVVREHTFYDFNLNSNIDLLKHVLWLPCGLSWRLLLKRMRILLCFGQVSEYVIKFTQVTVLSKSSIFLVVCIHLSVTERGVLQFSVITVKLSIVYCLNSVQDVLHLGERVSVLRCVHVYNRHLYIFSLP